MNFLFQDIQLPVKLTALTIPPEFQAFFLFLFFLPMFLLFLQILTVSSELQRSVLLAFPTARLMLQRSAFLTFPAVLLIFQLPAVFLLLPASGFYDLLLQFLWTSLTLTVPQLLLKPDLSAVLPLYSLFPVLMYLQ